MNLESITFNPSIEELREYYGLAYYYMSNEPINVGGLFEYSKWYTTGFDNKSEDYIDFIDRRYKSFLDIYDEKWHYNIQEKVREAFEILDNWDDMEFHKCMV